MNTYCNTVTTVIQSKNALQKKRPDKLFLCHVVMSSQCSATKNFITITWFELSVSRSRNMISLSIIAMPNKSHFTLFAIQNFLQNTKKHT